MKIKQQFNVVDLPEQVPFERPNPERFAERASRPNPIPEAIVGLGKAMGESAGAIGDFLEQKRKLDESLEASTIFNNVRTKVNQLELDLKKKGVDENNYVPTLTSGIQEITSNALTKTKSKNVQIALQKAFADLNADRINQGQDYSFSLYLKTASGKYAQNLYDLQQAYVATADERERTRIGGEAEGLVSSVAKLLGRDPDTDLRAWRKDAVVGAVKGDMMADPKITRDRIISGYYTYLPEEMKATLQREAEEVLRVREAEESKAKIDDVVKSLTNKYTNPANNKTDFDAILAELRNTEFQKEKGLTTQEAASADNLVKNFYNTAEAARQQVYRKTGQTAIGLFIHHQLTESQIDVWTKKDEMTEEQGRIWLNALETQANASSNIKTNDILFIHRFNQIKAANGDFNKLMAIRDQLVKDAKNFQFNREAYTQLFNLTDTEHSAIFSNRYFERADAMLKEQLGGRTALNGMMMFVNLMSGEEDKTGEAARVFYDAEMALVKMIRANQEKMSGDDLYKAAIDIAKPARSKLLSYYQGLLQGQGEKEKKAPLPPMAIGEAPLDIQIRLGDPKKYFEKHGNIPLQDLETGTAYKTDGKTWYELKPWK